MLFEEASARILINGIFSNILEKVGRRLIGLYEAGFWNGLLGLRINMTTEYFQVLGKYNSMNRALKMCDKRIMDFLDRFFVMILLIRS
jgi:hypothetical protein